MSYNEFLGIALLIGVFQIGFLFRVIDQVDKLSSAVKELKAERLKTPSDAMLIDLSEEIRKEEIRTELPSSEFSSSVPSPFVEGLGNVWQSQLL